MNVNFRYVVLAILTISILIEVALFVPTPLLYSLEKDNFSSPFHDNVEVLQLQSLNSTTDIVPHIQDVIDGTGPVTLDIRIHDLDQAQRDLDEFEKSQGSLSNLIVHLDMNESEIQAIEKNTAVQKQILDSLLNTSVSLDSLQMMEIQYRDQNNTDMLTTVRLQGNELRKRVNGLNERYRNATANIVATGTKFGLDMTKNQKSQADVDQIVQEIEQPKASTFIPVNTSLIPGEDRVSLFLRPDTGKYRDVIEYMGISLALNGNTTLRSENIPIILYIDDQPVSTILTDTFGYYDTRIPVGEISAGSHTVYTRSPTSRSVNRTLTVIPVDSVTNLTLSEPDRKGDVNCTGFVMANLPVRSASIQLTWDQSHVIVTKTGVNGEFMQEVPLPPGRHTVIAAFSGDGYPINASESDPQVVDIPVARGPAPDYGYLWLIISIIGIVLLFVVAAAFYLRRMARKRIPLPATPGDTDFPADGDPFLIQAGSSGPYGKNQAGGARESGGDSLVAYYAWMLDEHGLNAASRWVYEQLAVRIARDFRIKRYKALTAREISRNCRGKPYCGPFARLISAYERIRYSGQPSEHDQTVFETALHSTDDLMGGEEH
jgi:hypothetical protein